MRRVLVLGIGNRLMCDDGIGVYVVEALQKEEQTGDIQYLVGETDIDYCLKEIEGADELIIVDAAKAERGAGDVSCYPLEKYTSIDLGISVHDLHLFSIIPVMYPQLRATIIGIGAMTIDFGLELSETLEREFPRIVRDVRQLVHTLANA